MAQHDMNIANQGFPAFRADLNDALGALVSNSSGATAPTTTFAHQFWVDTSANPNILRQRNADNDAWIVIGSINQTSDTFNLAVAQGGTGAADAAGARTNLGALAAINPEYTGTLTGGTGVVNLGSGQFYKDASGNVGIGTSSPFGKLDVRGTTFLQSGGAGGLFGNDNTSYVVLAGSNTANAAGIYLNGQARSGFASQVQYAGSQHVWLNETVGVERMRIDSSGNLLVGKTAPGNDIDGITLSSLPDFVTTSGGTDGPYIQVVNRSNSILNGYRFYSFRVGSNRDEVGSISTNGTTSTSYNTSSDYRLKENIAPMTGALARVAALKPVTYTWKSTGEADEGFIAHELQEVCPSAVTGEKDAVDADGNPKYQGIDTSFLVATLTAAIQELKAELDTVKAELQTLKGN